jgi:4'-phosphopantetheinyl transferase EntD
LLPDIAFDLQLEHGRCVGVRLPDEEETINALAEAALVSQEKAFAATLTVLRRRTWVGGRVAMRQALARSGHDAPPMLADARGAPLLPSALAGSISHKEKLAVALVAKAAPETRLGVDIEVDAPSAHDIASRVLTDEEAAELAALGPETRGREVVLRFSAKEAIYKALDPFVLRYVDFKEVAVTPLPGGGADVRAQLRQQQGFLIEVAWRRWEAFVLTTARVTRLVSTDTT